MADVGGEQPQERQPLAVPLRIRADRRQNVARDPQQARLDDAHRQRVKAPMGQQAFGNGASKVALPTGGDAQAANDVASPAFRNARNQAVEHAAPRRNDLARRGDALLGRVLDDGVELGGEFRRRHADVFRVQHDERPVARVRRHADGVARHPVAVDGSVVGQKNRHGTPLVSSLPRNPSLCQAPVDGKASSRAASSAMTRRRSYATLPAAPNRRRTSAWPTQT